MSNKALIIIIVILLVFFFGGAYLIRHKRPKTISENNSFASAPTPTAGAGLAAVGSCVRDFDQQKLTSNKVDIHNRSVELDVKGYGKIRVEFYDKDAPRAVENFLRLVNSGYYDCLTFHRIAKGFVIQGGDPSGNGSGGKSAFGATFADELSPNSLSSKAGYVKGVLAMANSGPNTNGSQFFIMLDNQPQMPHLYTIFGKVILGQDVVDKIGSAAIVPNYQMDPSGNDGAPLSPIVITKAEIIAGQ